ncbi:hypothetical protein RAN3_1877 [plant metagenome]|uniref:Replication protein P n=1 Tax=plant metagenome TaxID=1297885 RepID=A0A484VCG3_9ZZZZ
MTTIAPLMSDVMTLWTAPRTFPDMQEPQAPIARLFNRLAGIYGGRWTSQFQAAESVNNWERTWSEALAAERLTPQEAATGLQNCLGMYEWPPSLPEFIKACRPNLAPENAFQEAVRGMLDRTRGEMGHWTHPAIFWAAVRVGQHDIMHLGYAVMKTRWEAALRDILQQGQWKDIPEVSMALPAPGNTQADRDAAAKQMRELGAGAALDQTGRDPRRWIAKVQQRCADGRKPSPTVLAMLQRATGGAQA